jgi:hypothetical protein
MTYSNPTLGTDVPQIVRGTSSSALQLEEDLLDGLTLATRGGATTVAVAVTETPAVQRAVRSLLGDLTTVCAAVTNLAGDVKNADIVVGTIGASNLIDEAVTSGELDLTDLTAPDGSYLWEGYILREIDGRLWVVGADRRGTVFGVYALCEAIGVSPWWWWADVPARGRDHITIPYGTSVADHPSVAYRGVFLNDEEELDAWAATHTQDGTIGPEAYERIFELLLRLRANYIWPAMHVNAFNADPENGRLANEMGIVVGTSHCDMLLRSNQHEWEPWRDARDAGWVEYDYSIPGENREVLQDYWRESVEQNRDYEATWTLGMRGIHDSGFHTRAIDDNESLTDAEKHRARVELLGRVIGDQRRILTEGRDRSGPSPLQTFVPYKEVLPLYDDGLDLPDDVTIIWSDDSFGHIRRFPNETEQQRSGGHGLYYHSSYWSPASRSYLWISSQPLAQMKSELSTAWDRGIRTLWVNNIGSLKPLEQDTEFFLRYAWEAGKETTTADTTEFLTGWIDRSFSGGHGHRVAEILQDWAQTTHVRRVEQLANDAFSQTSWGDETARRLASLRSCYDAVNEVYFALPEAERDAFFQLVVLKVHASYLTNAQFAFADRSTLCYGQGKFPAADLYLDWSRRFDGLRQAAIEHYNQVMTGGKWAGIMTPDAFPPPATAQYPAARPALTIGDPELGVVVWGEELPSRTPALTFSPYGTPSKWIEIYNAGFGNIDFTVTSDDWIHLPIAAGTVSTERRLVVTIPDLAAAAGRHGTIVVRDTVGGDPVVIDVTVQQLIPVELEDNWYLEADGHVTVPATGTTQAIDHADPIWAVIPKLGRDTGDLLEVRRTAFGRPTSEPTDANHTVAYTFHLTTPGAHLLEIHRHPRLDSTGRMRAAITVDAHPSTILESPTIDEYQGAWTVVVVEEVEKLQLRLPFLDAGEHVLRVGAIDEGFAFSRFVVHTAQPRRSALGPPTSRRADHNHNDESDPAPDAHDLAGAERIAHELYRVDPAQLPLPPAVYVPRTYWDRETTFTRNVTAPQSRPAIPPARVANGRKDLLAGMSPGPVFAVDGAVHIDVARALLNSADGWLTSSLDEPVVSWTHTQSETDGGAGLALQIDAAGRTWDDSAIAPGLHVSFDIGTAGRYRAWGLFKFDSDTDDSCVLSMDGVIQPTAQQYSGGDMFSFGVAQVWTWVELSEFPLPAGRHVISVLGRKARLRVDRLYLTLGDELPAGDADWSR